MKAACEKKCFTLVLYFTSRFLYYILSFIVSIVFHIFDRIAIWTCLSLMPMKMIFATGWKKQNEKKVFHQFQLASYQNWKVILLNSDKKCIEESLSKTTMIPCVRIEIRFCLSGDTFVHSYWLWLNGKRNQIFDWNSLFRCAWLPKNKNDMENNIERKSYLYWKTVKPTVLLLFQNIKYILLW